MPELPEVEHAARSLRRWLDGAVIAGAEASATRIFRASDRGAFERLLPGRRLARVDRRGKYLLLAFDGDVGLLSHLGMAGRWVRRAPGEPEPRHRRARLVLADGTELHYCDPRMLGRIAVHPVAALAALPEIRALGPDALPGTVDAARLHAKLARTSREVKAVLLDQGVIAGVGNIYATEALFRARVHPARPGSSITRAEAGRIARGIEAAIGDALAKIDVDALPYLSDGAHVENPFLLYGRKGEPCPRCKRPIEAVVIDGRTSAFCGACQPAGGAPSRPKKRAARTSKH